MTWIASLVAAAHLMGAVSSVHAVMSTRTPQGAVAWAVFLNSFPYLGVPAYWVFGRSRFRGYVTARNLTDEALRQRLEVVRDSVRSSTVPDSVSSNWPGSATGRLLHLPWLSGNQLELLVDGEATFKSILDGIDRAREYVLVQFFILHDDDLGRRLRDHLVRRAREGLRVHLLYDEIGSHDLPAAYLEPLVEAGVQVAPFHTRKGSRNRFQINFRNHRKLVVVDGREAWIGGHNVGDEYLGRGELGPWRDTHVRIAGPAVTEAQYGFVEDWHWATETIPQVAWQVGPQEDGVPVLVLPTGPADELETAQLMFTEAIQAAQERLWIATPYFVPEQGVIDALHLAALRGVDVRILIPESRDHWGAWLAAFSFRERAAGSGIRFLRYQPGFMHQKVILIDGHTAAVGTANFDNRSFRLNFELTALVRDEGFAAEVARMLEADFEQARDMPADALDQRPFWFRFAANVARLTAPIQ
jgi:cardiolipin synthase